MGNNDHCFSQPGDRGSTPFVLPMNTLVIPTSHKEYIFVYCGTDKWNPTVEDFDVLRKWVAKHRDNWPNNFNELKKAHPKWGLKLELFPERNPGSEYVFVLEGYRGATSSDIEAWKNVLRPREDEVFTIFCYGNYFESIKRINRNLVPFL